MIETTLVWHWMKAFDEGINVEQVDPVASLKLVGNLTDAALVVVARS